MCISILSERYITFELLAEHVFLDIKEGKLHTRVVYDLIFSLPNIWENPEFICINPNILLKDGKLKVEVVDAPGAESADDVVYDIPVGFGKGFDVNTHTFSVKVIDLAKPESPRIIDLYGEVVKTPKILIPDNMASDILAARIMSECGTVFKIHLERLEANKNYAMRLVIEPVELVGLSEPRNLDMFGLMPIKINWTQAATITCHKNCWFNCKKLLARTALLSKELAARAAAIEAMISDDKLKMARVKRSRITLIVPAGFSIIREKSQGCISSMGPVSTKDSREFFLYAGGIEPHWIDDVESFGLHIWGYMSQYAKADPKSKEYITTALGVDHKNVSLLVDSFVMHKPPLLEIADSKGGLFKALDVPEDEAQNIIRDIASDSRITKQFNFIGYVIPFTVKYQYLNLWNRLRFIWERTKPLLAFWLALISVILGAAALSDSFKTSCIQAINFVKKFLGF
jgi:hypothetical protein